MGNISAICPGIQIPDHEERALAYALLLRPGKLLPLANRMSSTFSAPLVQLAQVLSQLPANEAADLAYMTVGPVREDGNAPHSLLNLMLGWRVGNER